MIINIYVREVLHLIRRASLLFKTSFKILGRLKILGILTNNKGSPKVQILEIVVLSIISILVAVMTNNFFRLVNRCRCDT